MIAFTNRIKPFHISIGKCYYSEIIFYNLSREDVKYPYFKKQEQNDELIILLKPEYLRDNRFYLNDKRIRKIEVLFKGIFEDKLVTYLDDNCEGFGDIQEYIFKFMDKYDLSEADITYEGLRKMYFRYRKKNGWKYNKNFRSLSKTIKKPTNKQGRLNL